MYRGGDQSGPPKEFPLNQISIPPASGPLNHTCSVPGSKSITNRVLLASALSDGRCVLDNALFSDDTEYMAAALGKLDVRTELDPASSRITVTGTGGRFARCEEPLFIGNAGTAMRFLTAALTLGSGTYTLDGIPRMRERPIRELGDALQSLGAGIAYREREGYPPITVTGGTLEGGEALFSGKISSQYISAVMLAAPLAKRDTRIRIENNPVSLPYLEMTRHIMEGFGVITEADPDFRDIRIQAGQQYRRRDYRVESDASSASYFFAAPAVRSGSVMVTNTGRDSIQGDIRFLDALERMGCTVTEQDNSITVSRSGPLKGIDIDMRDISDTAPTLAVTALFADGPTRIRGVANMRVKETDRISALCTELVKTGARIKEYEDGLDIIPLADPTDYTGAEIATYDDHRMAMSFALAGLVIPGMVILDPECTAKTFPDFFDRFLALSRPPQEGSTT